jgi:indolepyruvate ferredoxin oxidoreductase alpha subunit
LAKLAINSDARGERLFLLGNEAIARGAIEGGVQLAAAYPGTPSSEIVETLAKLAKELDIYVEWSVNEKVALEVAFAASICGVRALATMKHVGVNVAHEPLMTASYIGAKGGFVILSADDPGMWSSQDEQDNRYIAEQAYIPVLEPSSVQEAKDMMAEAFRLSEEFGQPFMFRSVTRISHARSDVVLGEIEKTKRQGTFEKNPDLLVHVPAVARRNRVLMLERFERIKKAVNASPFNQLKLAKGAKLGIIACGISDSYAREAIKWTGIDGKVSTLKIGTPHPLPGELVKKLLESVEEVLVVEELEPFVENHVKAIAGENNIPVKIHGKDLISLIGELSTRQVAEAIAGLTNAGISPDFSRIDEVEKEAGPLLPRRPPNLCAGCPHRASFHAINMASRRVARDYGKEVEAIFPSDIGCYNLGVNPPLKAADTTICMGGSFGIANGLAHVIDAPIVAHLGDSTFFHSGIPPLINAVYNRANITMVVLDNRTTAMTGFQPHPGTGYTATGDETTELKIEDIVRACGVKFVEVIDPIDLPNAVKTIEKAIRFNGPSVVISRRPCAMEEQREKRRRKEKVIPCVIDQDKCDACGACIKLLGCPAIIKENDKVLIDGSACTGCGLCARVCPHKAIIQE